MTVAASPLALVEITGIAAGGDGVGHLADGRVVFVPRSAPGDLATVEVVREQKRMARARLIRLEREGPERVAPRCRHYQADSCGGCQLQHLSRAGQHRARRAIAGDALRRIGRLQIDDPQLVPAPSDWEYRTRISLACDREGRIGFHRLGRADQVFALERCELAVPALQSLWARISGARRHLPRAITRLTLRLDRDGGEQVLIETGAGPVWRGASELAARVARPGDQAPTIWWAPSGGASRVVSGGDDPYPPTIFEQVHPAMGDAVRRWTVDALMPVAGRVAWDLYSGIGETSTLLAAAGADVHAVEADRRAVEVAVRRHREERAAVTCHHGLVEACLPDLPPAALVVANPPRGGLSASVSDMLRRSEVVRIGYISCDPATLARDLGRLQGPGGFRLGGVMAFDLFPQTAHIETVAVLERA